MLCSKCNINYKNCCIKYDGNFLSEKLKKNFSKIKDKYFIILDRTERILFQKNYELYKRNFQKNNLKKILTQEQIDEALSEIDYWRLLYEIKDLKVEYCETFSPNQAKSDKFERIACNNMTVISTDLNVYQCVFDVDKKRKFGRVMDGKIIIDNEDKSFDKYYYKVLENYNEIGGQR